MKKKVLASTLAILVLAATLAGFASCRNNDGEDEAPQVIVLGTNAEFPPFEFISGGEIVGIDIAIARAVADYLGKELEIRDMDFTALIPSLINGSVDFVAAGMTASGPRGEERREVIDFSDMYFQAMQAILVLAGNTTIDSAADIEGRTVAAIAGYTGYAFTQDELNPGTLIAYPSPGVAVAALRQGSVEAIVIDYTTARAMANLNPDLRVVTDEEAFGNEYYAIAVRQGDAELLEAINRVLADLISSGELDNIIAYYMEYMED